MKSLEEINNALSVPLKNGVEWNLYVYKKRYKKNEINSYEVYKIDNISSMAALYSDIYTYMNKNFINKFNIYNYSSEMPKNNIGYINLKDNNNILQAGLELLNEGINNSVQFNSKEISLDGYILECNIQGKTYMKILSSSHPIKNYKYKYSIFVNKFSELNKPILSLNVSCDCIILDDYALFFTGRAENIFNLEKHYKALASKCLDYLNNKKLCESFETFEKYANSWPKAMKFEGFDTQRIDDFCSLDIIDKKNALSSFPISLNDKGQIITTSPEEMDTVLNFICGKLLKDFNDDAYEVSYPQKLNH